MHHQQAIINSVQYNLVFKKIPLNLVNKFQPFVHFVREAVGERDLITELNQQTISFLGDHAVMGALQLNATNMHGAVETHESDNYKAKETVRRSGALSISESPPQTFQYISNQSFTHTNNWLGVPMQA